MVDEIAQRKELARRLLSKGIEPVDLELRPDPDTMPVSAALTADLALPFPPDLAPIPQPLPAIPDPSEELPKADVVVITWTVDENDALADVLTPKFGRAKWYRYNHLFHDKYESQIRGHAPAIQAQRLGSYFPTKVGNLNVLCMKSELHLNQDGKRGLDGLTTLPTRDFFHQIITEVEPDVILTIGTAGSVFPEFQLGDVVVTRAGKFRCASEFEDAPFNGQTFTSEWEIPLDRFPDALELMARFKDDLREPPFLPPTKAYHYHGSRIHTDENVPDIKIEQGGRDMPEFHPILTTDFFEYGTTANHLNDQGAAVEMGDAVLGLVASEIPNPPKWAVVRNMSDPTINGDLPTKEYRLNLQTEFAVAYYEAYGYHTSVTGALATWGILAGMQG
jgi:phosphorylase superfamily protein